MTVTITVDGRAYTMTGRVAAMVLCLTRRRARLNSLPKGSVELGFAGRSLKVALHEVVEMTVEDREAP